MKMKKFRSSIILGGMSTFSKTNPHYSSPIRSECDPWFVVHYVSFFI